MRDIVVILPGITGSVLQKDGIDLWNISNQAIWQVTKSLENKIQNLKLEGDDPYEDDLGDGIRATKLIDDVHLIPGLWKIDGYTKISQLITQNFQVTEGDIYNDSEERAANFYHFPYDWRRDNRANAKILKRLLDRRLKTWRESSGNSNAKVILLAHSMGGLVSRYYLEVLGGWPDCRFLFTFGTPYRGSVNAVNFLANGYKKLFFGLTEVMRSLTSVYQLMPSYEMLKIDGQFYRIAESPVELPHIVRTKAEAALNFHCEIEAAVQMNQQDIDYITNAYQIVPFIGVQQPTLQSAEFKDGVLTVSQDLPIINSKLDYLADGDGTVPQISAFPIEFRDRDVLPIPSFIAESNGSLQNQSYILQNLLDKLQTAQSPLNTNYLGIVGEGGREIKVTKGISLSLDDLYFDNEPISITAKFNSDNSASTRLKARIDCISTEKPSLDLVFKDQNNEWLQLQLDDFYLESGLYRITVQTDNKSEDAPNAVHNLFVVVDSAPGIETIPKQDNRVVYQGINLLSRHYSKNIIAQPNSKNIITQPNQLYGEVRKLANIKDNWDSYGAKKPNTEAINNGIKIIQYLILAKLFPNTIVPSADEGIAISFMKGTKYADIECFNTGEILAGTSDYDKLDIEPNIWKINLNQPKSIENSIKEIKLHLS